MTVIFVIFLMILCKNKTLHSFYKLHRWIKDVLLCCIFIDLMVINLCLLIVYLRGSYSWAKQTIDRNMNESWIDGRTNEIFIEASRYVVLFGICLLNDLIACIIACINYETRLSNAGFYIMSTLLLSKVIIFFQIIYLSFKFGHKEYKNICYCCDQFVQKKFNTENSEYNQYVLLDEQNV